MRCERKFFCPAFFLGTLLPPILCSPIYALIRVDVEGVMALMDKKRPSTRPGLSSFSLGGNSVELDAVPGLHGVNLVINVDVVAGAANKAGISAEVERIRC